MKTRRLLFPLVSVFFVAIAGYAQQAVPTSTSPVPQPVIKTFQLDSKLMARPMPYSVILPANYEIDKEARFPVIYFLHGRGGSSKVSSLARYEYTDKQRVVLVFVEGGNGMYTDSATKPNDKYESYVVRELIPEVDKTLRTIGERKGRAIAGGSMGGYGALKFGIKYPQLFSLAASWSGAVNVTAFHEIKLLVLIPGLKENLTSVYGESSDRSVLIANDLFRLFTDYPNDKLNELPFFFLDCGTEDELGLFKPNRDLSQIMIDRKIPHEYREFPGNHSPRRPHRFLDLYELSDQIFEKQKASAAAK